MGFGTGLNAYLSAISSIDLDVLIEYHTVESDPVNSKIIDEINYPRIVRPENSELFYSLHKCEWNKPHSIIESFSFQKYQGRIENILIPEELDIIFYDAFAPSCQPDLWAKEIHSNLYNALKVNGILVTYCSQGAFRRTLIELGYQIEKLNGPGKKREMIRATKV